MAEFQGKEDDWVSSLPVLEGLFNKETSILLLPFHKFSISSMFRSSARSTNEPPVKLLQPILDQAKIPPTEPLPPKAEIVKALEGLKEFATHFKKFSTNQRYDHDYGKIEYAIERLCRAYLAGAYLISRGLWDNDPFRGQPELERDRRDLQTALEQCIRGFFILHLLDTALSKEELDKHILGSIFPPTETKYHYLSPLLSQTRQLITSLQTQPARSIAPSKLKSSAQFQMVPCLSESVSDEKALYMIRLLNIFSKGLVSARDLAQPSIAKDKNMGEEDARRPRRIKMEVEVMKCDLLLSMTTQRIDEVKRRAFVRLEPEHEDTSLPDSREDSPNRSAVNKEDKEELKPRLSGEGELPLGYASQSSHTTCGNHVDDVNQTRWENLAEESLVECLEYAKKILDQGRCEVLSDHVEAADWLGEIGVCRSNNDRTLCSTSKSPAYDHGSDDLSGTDFEDEDEDPFEDDSESEQDHDRVSHACPLRTIFRLHDRYEEQRLAIWLQLPAAKRGKMGWFIRGEDGRVGLSWDAFGLAAMMAYDSETLIDFGLGPDKLDVWLELASLKNAKKIKKRRKKT
ncbi:uncharacterized protein I206_100647 [Kwoniella pini CBS 10737]|uniref:Uncharacterized protein n=1 Tax=Kwoniella pini CBS 10737 TaxID=1296096 RepID=A0A1B9ICW5_9TREE|nr:uncharacterized protein I206_00678 [Kwoniella pini CBS 10737]OCF53376.1 hypothetical protein I206_00678 [Kwoniella pini CBS 10737]